MKGTANRFSGFFDYPKNDFHHKSTEFTEKRSENRRKLLLGPPLCVLCTTNQNILVFFVALCLRERFFFSCFPNFVLS